MKVDRSKLKKTPTEAPADCRTLIEKLKGCSDEQLLLELQHIKTWNIGKCELYHWVDLLDRFDGILCDAGQTVENMSWLLVCDRPDNGQLKALLLAVLNFTALLIEYSFSRHLYSSIEHLTTLLASCDMQVVLSVLNLLYVFSKRSNYITRLGSDKRTPLLARLQHLAESWGGKENGFGLAECCRDLAMTKYPPSATTLHFEFYAEPGLEVKVERKTSSNTLHYIHIEQLDKISESPSEIMESLTVMYNIPKDKQTLLFTHIRLAHGFSNHKKRLQAVQARLHAISILVYSNALQESANSILYNGLIEELVDVLQITDKQLVDIKAASLRTLTSIVHLERTPKLSNIIDCTGTASYHGFLPVLVRNCIQAMIGESQTYCEMSTLHAFYRLEHEVDLSRKECPFVIKPKIQRPNSTVESEDMDTDMDVSEERMESSPGPSTSSGSRPETDPRGLSNTSSTPRTGVQCIPQRAALLKSMLNFLKKAIQDPAFSDGIRHVMDGSLPTSLKHIISNAEYYGPSLFLLATEVVTVFVFQEPSLLSSLQDNGLTDVMLHALLIKDVPATREVLGSLPNVFSALCLNARGLHSFVQCQPFERLFKVLLSPDYLPAMRRRRSSDPLGDTASNLGSAVDELMRHQPTLKTDATTAIIKLLEEICNLGRAPEYICQKPSIQKTDGTVTAPPARSSHAAEEASSEDEEEEEALHTFTQQQGEPESNRQVVGTEERIPIPLMDYILNVMKFVESILSNNTTDDHCQEFVNQKGLLPLVSILGLPNLPIDFPTSAACQAVAGVCKSILTLSHEPKVLQEGLCQLDSILSALEPLHRPIEVPGGSVLLRELATAGHVTDATLSARATPLLHALTAAHAYILMFVHTCRVGQSEIRAISVNQWGSQLGLSVLNKLSQLYCSLVWESTVLLSLCTPNSLPPGCEFGQADMQKLVPKEDKPSALTTRPLSLSPADSDTVALDPPATGLLEGMGLDGDTLAPMETDEPTAGTADPKTKSKLTPAMATRIKQIKPLLSASSRLGRALAELFGLLVKLCVGSPVRQRRSHHATSTGTAPTPAARATASSLTKLLTKGLSWQPPPYTPTPRFRLTFFICSVGFTSPMLFDERKYPYHLMLQKFFCSGGHDALFETFNWALTMGGKVPVSEGLEHTELPDGTGEFLDAWLMLVEKMVNPSTVLDSPHSLPVKVPGVTPTTPQFSALRFLIVTQKAAFNCIRSLWNRKPLKVYGGRMAESMLAILCHILRGEPVIQERLAKEREGTARPEEEGGHRVPAHTPSSSTQRSRQGATARTHTHTESDYRLQSPPPIDMTMSEEDQMMRAIAMSLGQEVSMEQRSDSPEEAARRREEDDRRARERTEEEEARCLERFLEAEPLDITELHAFTDSMLPGCFHLLDELPDTVYRLCDLLMTAIKRSGPEYRDLILRQVVNQVWEAADVLIKAAVPLTTSDTKTVSEWTRQMATLPQASNLATRILLLTLLFEELKLSCARVVENSGILNVLIKLLEVVQPCLQAAKEQKDIQTPKWITPVLLIIDFYEKMAVSSKRRAQMNKYLQPNGNNWRWFDDRSGRWCSYSASNNSTIDSAWRAGESSVRFTAGRRRYTVQFNTMVQVNEETGNRRPVMLTVQRVPRVPKPAKTGSMTDSEREEGDRGKAEETQTDPAPLDPTSERTGTGGAIVVQGLTEDMTTVLIRACVSMISVPVDPDTLHATLRLCLRLTRTHHYAMMFAELKSTRMILGLTQGSGFNGFTPLVTLLFRHIIEDPATLRHTMEKVVRSAVTSGAGSTTSGVVSGSLGSREINYILRVLGPAACRNPDCFADTANSCVRIALPAPRGAGTASDDEFENLRIKGPNAVQLVKTTPLKMSPLPPIPDTIKEVIYDMLNALAAYHRPEERAVAVPGGQDLCQILQDVGDDVYQQYRLTRQGSDFDSQSAFHINPQVFSADGAVADSSQSGTPQGEASTPEEMREEKKEVEGEKGASSEEGKGAKAKASKPLMPTSTILRLLAELVRSYVGIATLIASYCYTAGQSELIKEDCSVLAFVLDHLLPHTQSSEDKDTPALARLFLASLAAAGTGTDAQVALVNEVKAALSRALAMAEGTEKHARLQAVMCIISTIMESCPSTSSFYSTSAAKTQHNGMNNIIRLFLKKGLVNDLARVPHSLDLSSPNMANTVNAALKPLETLSRIVNQPSSLFGGKGGSSKNKAEHDTVGAARDSNSNTQGDSGEAEGTLVEGSHRVQGTDSDLMDGETEGDTAVIAGQPEVLSTTAMQVENELVDLIDELLERDAGAVNSSIIADIPPSPGNIPSSHPLMVRHADHGSLTLGGAGTNNRLAQGMGRSQRTLRQLTANTGHTIHVHYPGNRQPNPPLILQRLLGPSAAADILQLSSSLPLQSRGRARLLVGNEDVHIIARSDDELLDDFFHEQSSTGGQAGTLSSIPTALTRWTDECKVLDAESMHDCVAVVKVPILQHLETLRDEELEERREKKRRQLAEEEEAKQNDRRTGGEEAREQSLQGSGLGTVNGAAGETTAEQKHAYTVDLQRESWPPLCYVMHSRALHSPPPPPPPPGISLPEGVDPSFLAALPEDIRREVLQNQLGIRPPARPPAAATLPSTTAPVLGGGPGVTEVSPEFLAALPPAIQEEVLAQQRAEQQRRELSQQPTQGDTPLDPVTFIQTLPSELRRSVLEDMEDSVLAVMPPDIAAEAAALRREQEARQRQLMHERLFGHSSSSALSAILRSPAFTSRLGGNRGVQYTRLAVQRGGTFQMGGGANQSSSSVDSLLRLRGRLLLDHEALSCLLVLLFVDEPKLNTSRLHRVLRNLCYHSQTRGWVIRSLLSILQRSSESEVCVETTRYGGSKGSTTAATASASLSSSSLELLNRVESRSSSQLSWLSVSMDAALGCRTNIFQIQRGSAAGMTCAGGGGSTVHIHPQAAPVVCRHVLDTLIQLAKVFPSHFTQQRCKDLLSSTSELDSRLCNSLGGGACGAAITPQSLGISTDFWDLLVKLDNMNVSRKGKASMKTLPLGAGGEADGAQFSLEASPLGQLMNMLSHPVIRRSSLLTEKLLRLLSLISIALPDNKATEVPAGHPTPQTTTVGAAVAAAGSVSASAQGNTVGVVSGKHRATVLCVESDTKLASTGLTEKQLQLSVEVLTSHSCSEEGLEDAANILLQLSRGDGTTRDTVLRLLLSGARHLGYTLCKQIGTLLAELREYNLEQQRRARADAQSPDAPAEDTSLSARLKAGKLSSRFDGSESVVIVAAQKRTLGGRELQLPCMSSLTSKTSTQKFFLRVLQVIIQLREDTRRANKKAKQTGRLGSTSLGSASSIQAAVRQLEAEADAIIQMVREGQRRDESPMDVDQPSPLEQDLAPLGNGQSETEERLPDLPLLSEQLLLDELWDMLGECLKELEESHDQHAVLVLQPAVEAFFLVHATERESKPPVRDTRESQLSHIKDEPPPLSPAPLTPATPSSLDPFFSREPSSMHISSNLPPDTQKFLRFAETHRTVLNQILRQSTTHLADGPFAVLVDYIRILDFDVKRKYFRQELERLDEGLRKEDMAVHVRRDHVFEDSYRELHRKSPEDMKNRLYIVFEGEEGQDAGGLLREWYMIISREMFNAMYALFRTSPGDRVTYTINPSSHCNPNHLSYFKFVGRVVAKAVYDNRLLECYFTRSFYKHILGKSVRYTDMESEDYPFFQGLVYLLENDVSTLGYELTFSTEVQEFGVCEVRDLKPNGGNIIVTEENKKEYVHLVCQMKMTGAIRKQLSAYLEGFYEIIPKRLISIFTEQELELLISGLPTIDIDDLKANTEYHKYQSSSIQIQWFWRALRSFDQADRAKFLQFVTGTSKVPLQGFAALEGMNGIQKFQIHRDDRSTDRLPSAHTCFNQLDLPAYESYEKLRHMLLLAIQECSEGFGLA
uniref:HECT-type E3 ubiquitin transferase n=1 Tax=Oncorhynchus mykiss TaxID=8022 RepID=A0A8C7QUY2_ONCMY